MHIVTVFIEKI